MALLFSADLAVALSFFLVATLFFTLAFTLFWVWALVLVLALVLSLAFLSDLAFDFSFDFFWLGILGVSARSLGDKSVPRQLAWPHQQGYSAFSFLV